MAGHSRSGRSTPAAVAERVSKRFGAIRALNDASLEVAAGQVHALLGHNGAGKSTLVKLLAGAISPDQGSISIGGAPLSASPAAALERGVRCIYQRRTLFPNCTVAENVAMGGRRRLWYSEARSRRIAGARLARLGCRIDTTRTAGSLSVGEAQEVDIARSLDDGCRLLILDEPTSSLSAPEIDRLLEVIRQVRSAGVGILFVSHELEVVCAIADRITVLRDGGVAMCEDASRFTKQDLVSYMLGSAEHDPGSRQGDARPVVDEPSVASQVNRLKLADVSCGPLEGLTIEAKGNEVLGVTGSLGSGTEEVGALLAGRRSPRAGKLVLNGKEIRLRAPRAALRHGIAYIPEDRNRLGLFANLAAADQIGLSRLALRGQPLISPTVERRKAVDVAARVGLKERDALRPVLDLSGGNQQKVMLARCLAIRPKVLVAHEPTVGVDVGSRAAIHGLLRSLASEGVVVIVISSDAEEIVEVADRAVVLHGGKVVADATEFDEGELVRQALGASSERRGGS